MIVVMKRNATNEMIQRMAKRVEALGLKAHVIVGTERTVIAAIGDKRNGAIETLSSCEEVEKVVPILAPYKVASRETMTEPTVVRALELAIGGGHVGVIAGPCSVESEEQIMQSAKAVKECGAKGLRGGAFKPRTSPYSFQGLGKEGLEFLADARAETGLMVVTEAVDVAAVDLIEEHADVIQIGARNMQSYSLLRRVGQTRMPVLLKRGMSATLSDLLQAAEYVLSEGNYNVVLCERGIRTFADHTRNTLDLSIVPVLKRQTHLPVIVDPSHGTGSRPDVSPMALAAVASGADGVMVEVHPHPELAFSDGPQSLSPPAFADLVARLRRVAEAVDRSL
jgi:3-deoxy-7-phosphoheptulonate synthase